MNLERIKALAGIKSTLMENVSTVPGLGHKHDKSDEPVDVSFDDEDDWAERLAREYDDQDVGSEFDPKLGEDESDMQTADTIGRDKAYSEFDALQGEVTEAYTDVCNQDNPESARDACTMEEGMEDIDINKYMQRLDQLNDSFVDPEEAMDIIRDEMYNDGYTDEEIEDIINKIQDTYGFDHEGGESDDAYALASAGHGSDEDYGYGDDDLEEEYDMNNGYYDRHYARKDDYFPDGADSPVVKSVGPSGAKQGDNPEQKVMKVDETHKEMVYAYRKFLKESKN